MPTEIDVRLRLTVDTPTTMQFGDIAAGLKDPWFRFEAEQDGSVSLWANAEGYEWLARYFLKLARSEKVDGYHGHHHLEMTNGPIMGGPELTIGICRRPESDGAV